MARAPLFGYPGRELDSFSGMMDYRARWYDPALGRFLTVDPIGFAAGDPNLYRYVFNEPTRLIDPTGNEATDSSSWGPSIETQRRFEQIGDQVADFLIPGRSLIPSGPNASPWWQLARDLTNPARLALQVAAGVGAVATSLGKPLYDAAKGQATGPPR